MNLVKTTKIRKVIGIVLLASLLSCEANKPKESNVVIEVKIAKVKAKGNLLVKVSLFNNSNTKYFIEKRFIHSSTDMFLEGFELQQNDKEVSYAGRRVKKLSSIFPKDYSLIPANGNIDFTVDLDKFFNLNNFNKGNNLTISYFIMNKNPINKQLDEISFEIEFK